jgi:hypothetical protein
MADPFLKFEAALPSIIADNPSQITRYRETRIDSFGDVTVFTAGPYNVRIEPINRAQGETWDEKGSAVKRLFELVGYNLPRNLEEAGKAVPLFKHGDTILDHHGNRYTVVAPQYVRGKMVQVTLELR